MYDSGAVTYLNATLCVVIEPALSNKAAPPPFTAGSPPPPYGSITFTHLEENSRMVKLPYPC
jgi:hypothetical protein